MQANLQLENSFFKRPYYGKNLNHCAKEITKITCKIITEPYIYLKNLEYFY